MAHAYNGILCSPKKEDSPDTCYKWMNLKGIILRDISWSKDKH